MTTDSHTAICDARGGSDHLGAVLLSEALAEHLHVQKTEETASESQAQDIATYQ